MVQIVTSRDQIKRVKTYIEGLDPEMQGGIPAGHITLIAGSAGTMKSSLCANVLFNEALAGRNGLYVSLEQSYASILNHMINLGYNFNNVNLVVIRDLSNIESDIAKIKNAGDRGSFILADVGCIRKEIKEVNVDENRSWLNVIKNIIKKIKTEVSLDHFVLDSMSALYVLSKFKNPRIELFYIFEFLRDLDITSFLISEAPNDASKYGEFDEDFLADGIISLKLTPFRRNVVREISLVKMRATKINSDVFSLEFKDGKFKALYGGQNPLL